MIISVFKILLLLLLVVLAWLLAYPRTRPFGLALLGVFGVVGLLLLGALFSYRKVEYAPAVEVLPQLPRDDWEYLAKPRIVLEQAEREVQSVQATAEATADLVKQTNKPPEETSEESADEKHEADSESETPSTDEAGSTEDADEEPDGESDVADAKEEKSSRDQTEAPAKVSVTPNDEAPDWINAPPSTIGGVFRQVIDSGPWHDIQDCYRNLDRTIYAVVQEFTREIAREELRRPNVSVPSLESLGVSTSWIREHLVCIDPEPFPQTTESSVGPMKTLYVQLEVDRNDREFLRERWREYARRDRIAAVAAGGTFLLGGIGLLFGLLKIDTWTKGYYTKRLFLGVPAAIIGIGALLALLIERF